MIKFPPPGHFARITRHSKPRYQLYQPGFNASVGCWTMGDWITVPKKEWNLRKSEHNKLYADVHKEIKSQSHRDKAVPECDMTKAQRQAWLFNSGLVICVYRNISRLPVSFCTQGNKISKRYIERYRKHGIKIGRFSYCSKGGKPIDNAKEYGIPEDITFDNLSEEDSEHFSMWRKMRYKFCSWGNTAILYLLYGKRKAIEP